METKIYNILKTIELRLKELGSKQGKVGWMEGDKYPDGESIAYVASIQEFGSEKGKIPPRPFMRPAVIENENKWRELAKDGAIIVRYGFKGAGRNSAFCSGDIEYEAAG